MGYTHYFYREQTIPQEEFSAAVEDFKKVLPEINKYVDLADGYGEGRPIIDDQSVIFNGRTKCGHEQIELHIPWPAKGAGGVVEPYKESAEGSKDGHWFAGSLISKRVCNGDCSYETFDFPRKKELRKWDTPKENGLYFDFCKTAFRPYDLAVITFLIIAKRHLKKVVVNSDGEDEHWFDGKMLCQTVLGYGLEFRMEEGGLINENEKEAKK